MTLKDTAYDMTETAHDIVERVVTEHTTGGGTNIEEIFDLLEAAVPRHLDPDFWRFTMAERMFTRLIGIGIDENAVDLEARLKRPGPRRLLSIDHSKPPFIIPRKGNHRHYGHWFPRGTVSLAAGASGTGKTVLLAHLLEDLRQGKPVLDHPAATGEYKFVLVDRTRKELRESVEDKGLDTEAILHRAYEIDFLDDDSGTPAEILDSALQTWEADGVPDVVVLEGADMWCGEAADLRKTVHFLKSLIRVATTWNVAVVASVGSPKQKPSEQYALTRDKVFGSIGWGRTCSTILHLSLTNPEDPDSARKVQVLPRTGRSETFHFEFKDGLLTLCEAPTDEPETLPAGVAETRSMDPEADLIAYLGKLPVGTVLSLRKLRAFGSPNTVSKRLARLSHPETGWVEMIESGRYVVKDRPKSVQCTSGS